MIEASYLSYAYESDPVLQDVSFSAERGSVTGILGPNGSGKSTLLSLLCGARKPDGGEVLLGGRPLGSYSARELARTLALVPQKSQMEFDFTVLDVVLMGRQPYRRRFGGETAQDGEIAREAMEKTGVAHLADRPVTGLSGGEWQRTVIARALAQQTPVLLLDEPVSNLDIRHQLAVLQIVRRIAKEEGGTVLCVLHDLNLAAHYCDKILLLERGRAVDFGSPENVLSRAGAVYEAPLLQAVHPKTGEPFLLPDYDAL